MTAREFLLLAAVVAVATLAGLASLWFATGNLAP